MTTSRFLWCPKT